MVQYSGNSGSVSKTCEVECEFTCLFIFKIVFDFPKFSTVAVLPFPPNKYFPPVTTLFPQRFTQNISISGRRKEEVGY